MASGLKRRSLSGSGSCCPREALTCLTSTLYGQLVLFAPSMWSYSISGNLCNARSFRSLHGQLLLCQSYA